MREPGGPPAHRRALASPTHTDVVATLAVIVAGLLAWQASTALLDPTSTARAFRLGDSLDTDSTVIVARFLAVAGWLAAIGLVVGRTRQVAAASVATGLGVVAAYLLVMWLRGQPVDCTCGGNAHSSVIGRVEVVGLTLGLAALAAFVAVATRRSA